MQQRRTLDAASRNNLQRSLDGGHRRLQGRQRLRSTRPALTHRLYGNRDLSVRGQGPVCTGTGTGLYGNRDLSVRQQGPVCTGTGIGLYGNRDRSVRGQGPRQQGPVCTATGTGLYGNRDLSVRQLGPVCTGTGTCLYGNRDRSVQAGPLTVSVFVRFGTDYRSTPQRPVSHETGSSCWMSISWSADQWLRGAPTPELTWCHTLQSAPRVSVVLAVRAAGSPAPRLTEEGSSRRVGDLTGRQTPRDAEGSEESEGNVDTVQSGHLESGWVEGGGASSCTQPVAVRHHIHISRADGYTHNINKSKYFKIFEALPAVELSRVLGSRGGAVWAGRTVTSMFRGYVAESSRWLGGTTRHQ